MTDYRLAIVNQLIGKGWLQEDAEDFVNETMADHVSCLRTIVELRAENERLKLAYNEAIHKSAALLFENERLKEQLHYANGTCDLAVKHRDAAEAEIERLMAERDGCFKQWQDKESENERLQKEVQCLSSRLRAISSWL